MSAIEHQPLDFEECACEDCRFWRAMDPLIEKHRDTRERHESLQMIQALRLAPDLETFEALLRGEKVPLSRLDPEWVKAYGRS